MADTKHFGPTRRTCGTWENHLRLLQTNPRYREDYQKNQIFINDYLRRNRDAGLRSGVVTIPVVVHIVYNTPAQNIPDAQIQSQIDVLNQDYRKLNADVSGTPGVFAPAAADCRLQFQLAVRDPNCHPTNGITRTSTSVTSFDIFGTDTVKSTAAGGIDPWPAGKYLNIWVCNGQSGQLGRGSFPGTPANVDGLICVVQAFGNVGTLFTSYNKGRTATHEIGHCFDLHHLWGDVSDCSGTDFVADTPNQQGPNYGCATFPHVTCSNGPNGDMFMNYMDYSDDACMFMFTYGQAARIEAALAGPRASLMASDGLIPAPVPDVPVLWSADTPSDTAAEPDAVSTVFYESDDIWVRNANDGTTNTEHQNPIFGSTNYVNVRVRNNSCGMPASANLKLYWAKASSGLEWPDPWDGSIVSPALMGSPIGTQPTGSVGGGGSVILTFPWSPPNPADYASFGADQAHFCLLSRIETSAVAPFGMTFAETASLGDNVRNNNKIVWKNVEVIAGGGRIGFSTVGNYSKEAAEISFGLSVPKLNAHQPPIGRSWHLELDFGKQINALLADAKDNKNVEFETDGKILVKKLDAHLGPISLKGRAFHGVSLRFVTVGNAAAPVGVLEFDLDQYRRVGKGQQHIGGQEFVFKFHPAQKQTPGAPRGLVQHWVHSHEEDPANMQAFRPQGFDFPPSRGRRALDFHEDGTLTFHDIAPADGLVKVEGYWFAEDDENVFIRFNDPQRSGLALRIHELGPDKLLVKRFF
ncbi:MAG TPA: zinc metalloprotease [Terriglobales bacterium]